MNNQNHNAWLEVYLSTGSAALAIIAFVSGWKTQALLEGFLKLYAKKLKIYEIDSTNMDV